VPRSKRLKAGDRVDSAALMHGNTSRSARASAVRICMLPPPFTG
jgi:hypothetical protein